MTRGSVNINRSLLEVKVMHVGNYKFTGKVLGKGSFAVVREAIHVSLKIHVSVKIIDLKNCNSYTLQSYLREATILQRVNHPYIMRIFETMQDNSKYYMVTELIQGGDLCDYVRQKQGRVEEIDTRRFSRQISLALKYLHGKGIVHRDLKLENIMLDLNKRNIKLIDFGLTNNWSMASPLKTLCGSPEYCAPELFVPGTVYGPEVDMWALGVIMFAMAAGKLPFPCPSAIMKIPEKKIQFLKSINDGLLEEQTVFLRRYSPSFTDLVKGLMNPNWEKRLTINDVLRDSWMTNRDHWTDVPHAMLDNYDLENIIRHLSSKLKTTPVKVETELKARPCGEIAGYFNIMTYKRYQERFKITPDIKSVSSMSATQINENVYCTSSKSLHCKKMYGSPIRMSLLGDKMKLNEITSSPLQQTVSTSPTTSESSCKSDSGRKSCSKFTIPTIKSLKPKNALSPYSSATNSSRTDDKSVPVDIALRKRSIGQVILPSKLKGLPSCDKSFWEHTTTWQKNLVPN